MICSENDQGSICSESDEPGYYFNTEDEKSNNLLYCSINDEYYMNCEISEQENGYFINSYNNDVIKCNNSICDKFSPGNSCINNDNEIIMENNYPYFCHENELLNFLDIDHYYELPNVNASSIFPTVKKGNDSILLKISRYSVSQYITESEGNTVYFKHICFLFFNN